MSNAGCENQKLQFKQQMYLAAMATRKDGVKGGAVSDGKMFKVGVCVCGCACVCMCICACVCMCVRLYVKGGGQVFKTAVTARCLRSVH